MVRFERGMTVMMSNHGQRRYHDDPSNPHNLRGEVINTGSVQVRWSNGQRNWYNNEDLVPVQE